MAILRESPWYQEILTEGEKIGVQRQLVRVLQRRFGAIPQDVQTRFEGKSVEQLDSLMDAAITVASLNEFLTIVAN